MHEHNRKKVRKAGGGHPTGDAVKQLLDKVDEDGDWFPGKHYGERRGSKRVLVGAKATAVATSAMAQKARRAEPTYTAMLAACPGADLGSE